MKDGVKAAHALYCRSSTVSYGRTAHHDFVAVSSRNIDSRLDAAPARSRMVHLWWNPEKRMANID